MDVSVIIVNYNTKELTKACIDSVFAMTSGVSFEVILVDNASTDGSIELFEKDERILFIESGKNLGFGKANNLGYQYAKGKYLFLLNSDTLLLNNAIQAFYLQMEQRDASVACMGCLLIDAKQKPTHSYGRFPTFWNELVRKPFRTLQRVPLIRHRFDGYDDGPLSVIDEKCFEVEYVTGADLFMRKTVADQYGLFDPDFFMYYEECEMQYRYRKHGYFSAITDAPKVQHLVGGSDVSSKSLWGDRDVESLVICCRKMYGHRKTQMMKYSWAIAFIPMLLLDLRYPASEKRAYMRRLLHA